MANDVLKLTWAADGEADEATLNLLDFISGLTLADGGWIPQVASGDQSTVTETMTFRAHAMTHDQLAGYVQVLSDWIIKVGWSHDFTQRQFVWLNARWKSETKIRRAPVYSLSYSLGGSESSPFGPYVRDDSFVPTLTIVIVRGAYWEDTTLTALTLASISAAGGKDYLLSGISAYVAVGDVPARISRFKIEYTDQFPLRYFWFGLRSSRNGILNNFVSTWELELASYLLSTSSDTTVVADVTASGGNKIRTTFANGATLKTRCAIKVLDVTANEPDQRGTYVCLLRAKMSDTSIARVRASSGFELNAYYINPRATVQVASWKLYNLGIIRLPAIPREYSSMTDVIEEASIIIDAERVSGSGNLEMDCLYLIPYNDAYVDADNGNTGLSLSTNIMTTPDFLYSAFTLSIPAQTAINQNSWVFIANNEAPLLVAASAETGYDHLLDAVEAITAYIVPRWRTLRGNE